VRAGGAPLRGAGRIRAFRGEADRTKQQRLISAFSAVSAF
jgi:hypothetical protein